MVYTELDVFKKCISSKTTQTKLGGEILCFSKPQSKESVKAMLKLYYKVWSGFSKFIRAQVTQQRCVYFSLVGSFTTVANFEGTQSDKDKESYCYIPDMQFL